MYTWQVEKQFDDFVSIALDLEFHAHVDKQCVLSKDFMFSSRMIRRLPAN